MLTKKRLFYDLETSFCKGHFWRPGYNQRIGPEQITDYAKIISVHWKWAHEDTVHNLDWGLEKQCDKKLLEKFIAEMDKADEIITHNGRRFDTPWIRTRAIFHNIPMRHTYNEIDTYKLCKKYLNLPSNSLKEVCKYYGLPAKLDAGGIDTWKDVVFKKDKKALKHLLYYGDGDIISLEAVFHKLLKYIKPNMQYSVLNGGDKYECPECGKLGRLRKTYTTAAGTIQHYMSCTDKNCITSFKINNKTYMNYLQYKIRNNIN
jgi:predicted PolB exonuclease-like 3'-5' exonuclease